MIRLTHPLPGSRETDTFGWRSAIPSAGVPAMLHNGQDYAAPAGTPIRAAHSGVVEWAGWDHTGGGNMITLSGSNVRTQYLHMLHPSPLRAGQRVTAGQTIGYVGSSGAYTTGNHLHFTLILPGGAVDPRPYLRAALQPKPRKKNPTRRRKRKDRTMIFGYLKDGAGKGKTLYCVWRPGVKGSWWQFTGQGSANSLATQLGNAMQLSRTTFNSLKRDHDA